jgi:hypothetical protein
MLLLRREVVEFTQLVHQAVLPVRIQPLELRIALQGTLLVIPTHPLMLA